MTTCSIHTEFFDDTCTECRKEYAELKGLDEISNMNSHKPVNHNNNTGINKMHYQNLSKDYKEFTEERAKRLYEDLLLQFLKSNKYNEDEASQKARSIIRKQCQLRNMPFWPWL